MTYNSGENGCWGLTAHYGGSLHTPVISPRNDEKGRKEAEGITDSWRKGREEEVEEEEKRNNPSLDCQLLFVILPSLQYQESEVALHPYFYRLKGFLEWLEATQLVSGLLGLLQPLLPYCHHLFKVTCPSLKGDIDSPDLSEIKLQVGGRASPAPRGGAPLSHPSGPGKLTQDQEMEFEFSGSMFALQRDLGHRKNKFQQRSQQVLLYMNAKSWMVNLFARLPQEMGWRTSIIELLLLGTVLVVVEKAEHSQNPPFSHLTTIRHSQMLVIQTPGQTCTSAKWHHFVSIIVENRMITKGEISYTIVFRGGRWPTLKRLPGMITCFSCSDTVLSSQSLLVIFLPQTPLRIFFWSQTFANFLPFVWKLSSSLHVAGSYSSFAIWTSPPQEAFPDHPYKSSSLFIPLFVP